MRQTNKPYMFAAFAWFKCQLPEHYEWFCDKRNRDAAVHPDYREYRHVWSLTRDQDNPSATDVIGYIVEDRRNTKDAA